MPDFTITLDVAKAWATSWRTNPPKDLAKGHLIPGGALSELLATNGVVDVRAYMGVDETGTQKLMFVGVDANGKDLIDANHLIYDNTEPCPKNCDPTSPLYNP
ncbi:hypothetical protein B0I03_10915 [Flavobacterium aquaticum]|jgi:hypothetical protein|uniref:Uncharacterized protein n=1 Tax=Flavobacterium aquaticum TaxID=1236486 RepID=A0A327YJ14_9FLAO|nr:hypothetical protein [Flavobacterium aquaticum]RAK19755.1 hypothetical protein B0I03_10915 [Flavobacterium aquaticum]